MATWKQIEERRELRLWIKEVIVPTVMAGAVAWSIPEVRENIKCAYNDSKDWIKSKLKK